MERVIVDRFEGNVAVVEAGLGRMRNVPRSQLPPGTREGDVLTFDGRAYHKDATATSERSSAMRSRTHRLFGD
jgi:hypothetical protein